MLIDTVLTFWFGDSADHPQHAAYHFGFWFGGDDGTTERDAQIRTRFGTHIEAALQGNYQEWADQPRGRLALILVLDQFTRNVYRGTARAFAGDERALELTQAGLQLGHDEALHLVERIFFLMPLQHAETLALQKQSVAEFTRLWRATPMEQRAMYQSVLDYAHLHQQLILRFGRFPHRNSVLGRPDTDAERAYLNSSPDRFGQ